MAKRTGDAGRASVQPFGSEASERGKRMRQANEASKRGKRWNSPMPMLAMMATMAAPWGHLGLVVIDDEADLVLAHVNRIGDNTGPHMCAAASLSPFGTTVARLPFLNTSTICGAILLM